jgi:integrase
LHHINKSKPTRTKLIKLKEPKRIPKTLSQEQVKQLIDACDRCRDKFLIALLYESGMRMVRLWDSDMKISSLGTT